MPDVRPADATCQAEDQGGHPCGAAPVVFQLTEAEVKKNNGRQMYFCKDHRTNKFVWDERECEYIPDVNVFLRSVAQQVGDSIKEK